MRLCFLINPTENWLQAVERTRQLATSAVKQHDLTGVFFYGQAAQIIQAPQEQLKWQEFSDYPLFICRTMVDSLHLSEDCPHPGFKLVGMAPWVMIMEHSDRIVEII